MLDLIIYFAKSLTNK